MSVRKKGLPYSKERQRLKKQLELAKNYMKNAKTYEAYKFNEFRISIIEYKIREVI